MLVKNILNASVEAMVHSRDENRSKLPDISFKSHYTLEDYLKGFQYKLILVSALCTLVYIWALFVNLRYHQRRELSYALDMWLLFSLVTEKFCVLTRFNIFSDGLIEMGAYKWMKNCRRCFLTLYAYIVVVLALYSYNLVFKTLFKSPVSSYQIYKHWAVIYILSCLPTLYFLYVYGFIETDSTASGYFSYTWQFEYYFGQRDMAIVLFGCYIIPSCVTLFLMGGVIIELMKRKEFFLIHKQKKKSSLRIADQIFIVVSIYACYCLALSCVAFSIQELVGFHVEPNAVDKNRAEITEVILFCNLFAHPWFFLMLYGYYCSPHNSHVVPLKKSSVNQQKFYCGYKAICVNSFRGNSEKSDNNSPGIEEEKFESEKHKINNETV